MAARWSVCAVVGQTGAMTWGISGDRFLAVYVVTLAAAVATSLLWRWWATAGSGDQDSAEVVDLAYLHGGGVLACQVGLASLRMAGLVDCAKLSTLVATGRLPAGAPALMRALHRAMRRPQSWPRTVADPDVGEVLRHVHRRLLRRGSLLSASRQRRTRLSAAPVFATALLGVVRLGAGVVGGDSPGGSGSVVGLILLTAATVLGGWYLLPVSQVSRSGRHALRQLRRAHADLDPRRKPVWKGRSVDELTLGMALFGPAPLLAVDPEFAQQVGIHKDVRYPMPREFDTGGYGAHLLTGGSQPLP